MRHGIPIALLVLGFTSTMVQVVLLRELLVDFLGNELSIGVMLANWLLIEALGSWGSGRLSRSSTDASLAHYVGLQVAVAALLPLAVAEARIVRNLAGFVPGQGVGLPSITFLSLVIMAPLALCDGAQFTLGCRIFSAARGIQITIGSVYALEAGGAVIGGIAATFLFVPWIPSTASAFIVGALNLLSGLLLIVKASPTRLRGIGIPATLTVALVAIGCVLLCSQTASIETATLKARWKGYELIRSENSVYGNIAVVEQAEQITFFVDGVATVTSPIPDVAAARTLVHITLLAHGNPKTVLVIGGGAGGVLSEILRYNVTEVVYVEQDPLLIRLIRDHPTNTTQCEFYDPRVKIESTDGRRFLARTGDRFDVVLMNLPYPSSLSLNRFYTVEFLALAGSRLAEGGILAFPVPGATGYLSTEERKMNRCMLQTLSRSFDQVRVVPGAASIFLASNDINLSAIDPQTLCERYSSLNMDTIVPCHAFEQLLDPARADWYRDSLEGTSTETNRDLQPCAVFYSLAYWTSIFSPRLLWAVRALERTDMVSVLAIIAAIGLVSVSLRRRLLARGLLPIPFVVASTGFFGMGINVAVILAFQSFFGYLYQEIGLILTAFMLGLWLGGSTMNRLIAEGRYPGLARMEAAIVAFCPSFLVLLLLLGGLQDLGWFSFLPKLLMLGLNTASGFMVGSEFSLCSRARVAEGRDLPAVAGAVYAWDLLGAVLGSLVLSIILFPLAGVVAACLCIIAVKGVSLVLLATSR